MSLWSDMSTRRLSVVSVRDGLFNLKGGGGDVAEKNILILVEEKKKSDSEFLSYNLMLNYGNKFRAWRDKKNILTLVLSEIFLLNETKNHTPAS